ncbi:g13359 [Coccomyxa viridis]|uniref:tRNA pseudouridine synthase n=1 Tax=Coccomyxa viridis TaxID=1274662 RepID=A0ABP1GJQ2_9CHLO
MPTWLPRHPSTFLARVGRHLRCPSGRFIWQHRCVHLSTIAGSEGLDKPSCTYKATVAYDGTAYKGFQLQNPPDKRKITIQGELEACLTRIFSVDRRALKVQGAGRTDSGVHARGQVVSFSAQRRELDILWKSMNSILPKDIRVVTLQEVPHSFNARHSATGKTYAYVLDVGSTSDPFMLRYSQYVWRPVDVQAMRDAAQLFIGRHDFTQFANTFPHEVDPTKAVRRFTVTEMPTAPHLIRLEVEGSGFLYKMVRHMVGALIAVGTGIIEPSVIARLLIRGSSQLPGEQHRGWAVAEAQGLTLEECHYAADHCRLQQVDAEMTLPSVTDDC